MVDWFGCFRAARNSGKDRRHNRLSPGRKPHYRKAVMNDMAAVTEVAHGSGAMVKVILETPLLTLEEKILSCQLSLAAKADFVKTATGFFGSAAPEDVSLMRGVVGNQAGVKASSGIRTAATTNAMIDAGANRIGASAGVAIVRELGAPEFTPRVKS